MKNFYSYFDNQHCKNATIHQVTTMLSTSKKCPISRSWPPANHLYWWPFTGLHLGNNQGVGYQYQWLAGGYDLEIGHF